MNKTGNRQIYEEASEWLVELRTGELDAATRRRLDAWFRASPEHIRAYLELSSIWEDGGDPDIDHANSTDALIALARMTTTQVVPFQRPTEVGEAQTTAHISSQKTQSSEQVLEKKVPSRLRWVAAVAAVSVIAASVGFWLMSSLTPVYATRTGEEKSIQLPDGSRLQLNSRSRVRLRFSAHEREVDLLEGQALFQVAKDAARPFVVHSDTARVRAVGTQFDVYRKEIGTTVTVVEGRVAVLQAERALSAASSQRAKGTPDALDDGSSDAIFLAAGEQVTVAPSRAARPTKADVATAIAWTQHLLVFDATPLADVAQEFNRYNVRQLIVNDAGLTNFHVTGVFSSTDPASLLRFLRAQSGISVEETDEEIRIAKK